MKITIREVAKHAGVSIKTVSRVINNEAFVRDGTRTRVLQAIRELGYAANVSAQRLARGRSYTLGLIYHNASWHYISRVMQGVLETGRRAGYGAILHPFNADRPTHYQEIMDLVLRRSVDGFIFTPPADNSTALLNKLEQARVPFVRLTPSDRQRPSPYVTATDWQGAYDMTCYLLSQGHRRIGFIKGPTSQRGALDRWQGFRAALEEYGLAFDPALVQQGDDYFNTGRACAAALLALDPPPTAIFANNDEMAAGANAAVFQKGLAVPGDVSIAGFDDIPLAAALWPPLTTVRQPIDRIAEVATGLLIDLLDGKAPEVLCHELSTELVIRESVRAVP